MIPSSRDLIRGIARTLEQDVLPDLATATWTASYIRSCLALLAHLEERVVHEGPILFEDNADLRTLLADLRTDLADPLPEAAARISAVLELTPAPADYPTVEQLDAVNQRLKSALDQTIAALHASRQHLGDARFQALNGRVMAYLTMAGDREFVMFDKASRLPPL